MARYSLIMSDQTYTVLVYEALRRNMSMGKLLNEIINKHAAEIQKEKLKNKECEVCGKPAEFKVILADNQVMYVCGEHKKKGASFKKLRVEP